MNSFLFRRLHWLNVPGVLLLMLLQRTPALRIANAASEVIAASPMAAILRSAFAAAASLGALHSLAGATQFVQSPGNPVAGTVGSALQVGFTYNGTPTPPQSFTITGGSLPPGLNFIPAPNGNVINSGTPTISGTPTQAGSFSVSVQGFNSTGGTGLTNNISQTIMFEISPGASTVPTISAHPTNQAVTAGGSVTFAVAVSGSPQPSVQWEHNGTVVGSGSTLVVDNVQPTNAGVYRAVVTNSAGSVTSDAAILGLLLPDPTVKFVGTGTEVGSDILHPRGNTFDQILLEGQAITFRADAGQITRMSCIDQNHDIIQVEFSGAGAVTVLLEGMSGPAEPEKYEQNVQYVRGHPTVVLVGADQTTNLSVFSVGRANAVNQALFKDTEYDGFADVALVAIASTDGKFAGLRMANTSFFNTKGLTGVYAPGVTFDMAFFVFDVNAFDSATPVLRIGGGPDTRITGGDLVQANGRPVQVSGFTQLRSTNGQNSHGVALTAKTIVGPLQENGVDVTSQIVVNPSP